MVECPRIPQKPAPRFRTPAGGGTAHFSMGVLVLLRRRAPENLVAIEAIAVYCFGTGKAKWKSRYTILSREAKMELLAY
jgi:hypothetical protein